MFKLALIVFAVFLTFILGMGIGVIFGRSPIKGSCGGLGKVTGDDCDFCGKRDQCERKKRVGS